MDQSIPRTQMIREIVTSQLNKGPRPNHWPTRPGTKSIESTNAHASAEMRILDGRSKMDAESTNSLELAIGSLEPHSQPKKYSQNHPRATEPKQPGSLKPTVPAQQGQPA
ncbi:hypothetical protein Nepgr_005286 [Nepenthes gracilis]|uniref:Uncharacterized protein n=1 Tax=Nepenthes gracilis TaxID=150966 RepID=A0AAD3XGA1_NEPGR|nr:hypothetical protein Nepgr_005286 [Nepenthes gracilis]